MSRRLLTFQRKFDGYKRSKLLPSWLARTIAPFHPLYLGYYHVEFVEHRQRPCTPRSYSLFFRSSLYPFVPETTLFMPNEHVGERCSFQPRLDNFSTFFPPLLPRARLSFANFFISSFSMLSTQRPTRIKVRVENVDDATSSSDSVPSGSLFHRRRPSYIYLV